MEQLQLFDAYQKKGLLPSLGSSDDIYTKLKASAEDIVAALAKDPVKILPFTLVAFDNDIAETELVLEEVETIISAKWQMLRSHFQEMPISLYRAVIIEALSQLVLKENIFAVVVWFTAIDIYPLLNISQKEQEIVKDFLDKLGDHVETIAIKDWTIAKDTIDVKIPKLELQLIATNAKVKEDELLEFLIAAAGPSGADGKARPDSNPNWTNSPQNWSYQFAPRAAKGISSAVNGALYLQTNLLDKNTEVLQQSLTTFFAALGKNMQTALKDAIQSSVAVERRSQLLWWKETLYSKKLHKSYRSMTPFECSIAMAFDLYHLLPNIFPVSVDYIIKEAYGHVHGFNSEKIELVNLLSELEKPTNKPFLYVFFTNEIVASGRTDLYSFMKKIISSKLDIKTEMIPALGIIPQTKVTYQELSVWILHCLSAKHLIKR